MLGKLAHSNHHSPRAIRQGCVLTSHIRHQTADLPLRMHRRLLEGYLRQRSSEPAAEPASPPRDRRRAAARHGHVQLTDLRRDLPERRHRVRTRDSLLTELPPHERVRGRHTGGQIGLAFPLSRPRPARLDLLAALVNCALQLLLGRLVRRYPAAARSWATAARTRPRREGGRAAPYPRPRRPGRGRCAIRAWLTPWTVLQRW
jgi:hypothetical protein